MSSLQAGELNFIRIFDAPRDLVFRCMIDPQHLVHFWGPKGMTTPIGGIVVEPRPGGAFETTMVNDHTGSEYRMRAVFREVLEPERLVWADIDSGMVTATTFTDLGDGRTEVHIHQARVPEAALTPEAQSGFLTSLDKLSTYINQLARSEEQVGD
jgi:uncharacterized protein YndB with AHSA1/START domain